MINLNRLKRAVFLTSVITSLFITPLMADEREDELQKSLDALSKAGEGLGNASAAPASTSDLDQMQSSDAAARESLNKEAESPASQVADAKTSTNLDARESLPSVSEPGLPQILDIEVRGNQIVSTSTILTKIKSQKGSALKQDTVNEDIKRLYAAGFFEDIKIEVAEVPGGVKLMVAVIEKPVVKEIRIEGAAVFKEDKILKQIKLIEGQVLDRQVVKQGVDAIQKLYTDKGFRFVDVQSTVDVNDFTKEAVVTIKITEGEKYKIGDIRFEGNNAFKSRQLIKMMRTRKKWLIIRSGTFKNEYFEQDMERLQLFYQQEGYLDVKMAPSFEYDKEEQRIFIKIQVEEGKHYEAGDISIKGNKIFPESEIWQELEMLPGTTYSQYYLAKDVEKIRAYYHKQGYMDARIIPDIRLNKESGKVDLTYEIEEGDLYFVEKVVTRGNTKTKDIVIRRELRIRPGERFDGEKIEKSKQRLENLGFFEEVTYDTEPSPSAPNRKDLIFRVKEKRTGELSFGGGISSIDRLVGFAEISQKNFDLLNWPRFTGGGQSLSVRGRVGTISQDYSINFYEPYVLNRNLSYGLDLFNTHRDNENVDFEERRLGVSNTFSRLFKDLIRVGSGYTLERVKLTDISDDAPSTVRNFDGVNWLSRWQAFTSYDTRDNIFNPTKGLLASFNAELVGSFLGGDQDFYVFQTSVTKYWTVFKKHLIEFRGRLGTSQEFGDSDEVPVFDRFYAGGLGSVRGYNYRRVGPLEAGDAIGGQTMNIWNLEYTVPVPRLDAFRFALFTDMGHINRDAYDINFGDYAVSIGPGIKIKTPLGPVAFYYGFPIANRDTEDKNGRFEFSLSRGF